MKLNDFLNTSSANQSTPQFEVSTSLGKEAISTRMNAVSRAIARVRQLEAYSPAPRSSSYGRVAVSPEFAPDVQVNTSAALADAAAAEAGVDRQPVTETTPSLKAVDTTAATEGAPEPVLDPEAIRQQVAEAFREAA